MENRDVRTIRTTLRSSAGQPSGGPRGVSVQSRSAMARPTSPPSANSDRSGLSSLTAASRRDGRSCAVGWLAPIVTGPAAGRPESAPVDAGGPPLPMRRPRHVGAPAPVSRADDTTQTALVDGNRRYEERFG